MPVINTTEFTISPRRKEFAKAQTVFNSHRGALKTMIRTFTDGKIERKQVKVGVKITRCALCGCKKKKKRRRTRFYSITRNKIIDSFASLECNFPGTIIHTFRIYFIKLIEIKVFTFSFFFPF